MTIILFGLMQPCNIAAVYDIFTEDIDNSIPSNQRYGEVHIVDARMGGL
jgi:hypothetical protein